MSSEHTWKSPVLPTAVGVRQWKHDAGEKRPLHESLWLNPAYRIFVGLTTLAAAVLIAWFIRLLAVGPPPAYVVVIGASDYADASIPLNSFGRQDMELVTRAVEAVNRGLNYSNYSQFVVREDFDQLSGDKYDQVIAKLADEKNIHDSNLLIFATLHARVHANGRAEFLLDDGAASVADFLKTINETSARHVVLFIDCSRLGANWQMGVLANQFPSALRRELDELGSNKLTVVCASADFELSLIDYSATETDQAASVFFLSVLRALAGEADGVRPGSRDSIVDLDELTDYVTQRVSTWAFENRGRPQSITVFGHTGTAGRSPQLTACLDPPIDPFAVVVAADDEDAEAADSEADAAGDDAKAKPKDDGSDPKSSEDGEEQPTLSRDAVAIELANWWKRRDELREQGLAALTSPAQWQQLQYELLRCEQLLEHGLLEDTLRALKSLESGFQPPTPSGIAGWQPGFRQEFASALLPFYDRQPPQAGEDADAAEKAAAARWQEFDKLVSDVLQAEPDKPIEIRPVSRFLNSLSRSELAGFELELAHRIAEQSAEKCDYAALTRLKELIQLIDSDRRPTQLLMLMQFWSLDWQADESGSLSRQCGELISARRTLEQLLLESQAQLHAAGALDRYLHQAFRHLQAAERWLLLTKGRLSGPTLDQFQTQLRLSRELVAAIRDKSNAVDKAVRLQAQLYAELPAFAQWLAQLAENDVGRNLPTDWNSVVLTDDEQLLRDLYTRAQEFQTNLATPANAQADRLATSSIREETAQLLKDYRLLDDDYRELRKRFRERAEDILREKGEPAARMSADLLLQMPWLSETERHEMLELRRSVLQNGVAGTRALKTVEAAQRQSGIWQGYWAIEILRTAGRDVDELIAGWDDWVNNLRKDETTNAEIATKQFRAHLELADDIRAEFFNLTTELAEERPPAGNVGPYHLRIAMVRNRGLAGEGSPSSQGKELFQLLATIREALGPEITGTQRGLNERFDRLLEKIAGNDFQRRPGMPTVRFDIEEQADADGNVTGFQVTNAAAPVEQVRLLSVCPIANVLRNQRLIDPQTPLPIAEVRGAYQYEFTSSQTQVGKADLVLAMLGPDDYPIEIRQLSVARPPRPDDWHVVFLANAGDNVGRRNRRIDNKTTNVRLPVSLGEKPFAIGTYIIKPSGDNFTNSVDVSVFVKTADGRQELIVPKQSVTLTGKPGQPQFLPLEFTPATPGETPAPPATTSAPTERDLSRGLIFKLELAGRAEFEKHIDFEVISADSILQEPTLTWARNPNTNAWQLEVGLELKPATNLDPLLPKTIPVALKLPNDVLSQAVVNVVAGDLIVGAPSAPLICPFKPEFSNVQNREPFEALLDVGGIPHAYRWTHVQPGAPTTLQRGSNQWLRIAGPDNGRIYNIQDQNTKETIDLSVQLDGSNLGRGDAYLEYELTPKGAGFRRTLGAADQRRTVRSARTESFRLTGLQKGLWQLRVDSSDYKWKDIKHSGPGPYDLLVKLHRNGNIDETKSVTLAVDGSAPVSVELTKRFPEEIQLGKGGLIPNATIRAEDPESGIAEILVAVDEDKDGKLSEKERLAAENQQNSIDRNDRPLASTRREVNLSLSLNAYAESKEVQSIAVLIQATNGAGITTTKSLAQSIRLKPPKAPTPPSEKLYTLQVQTDYKRTSDYTWTLLQGDKEVDGGKGKGTYTFSKLKPGSYTIRVKGFMRSGNQPVTIIDMDKSVTVPTKRTF